MLQNTFNLINNNLIKKNQNIIFNKWNDFSFPLENKILLKNHITNALSNLFEQFNSLDNHYIQIQFKVEINNGLRRSISYVQTVKTNDFSELLDSFIEFWNIRSEEYHISYVKNIIFTYKILSLENSKDYTSKKISKHKNIISQNKLNFSFSGFNLPMTMDITTWGKCIFSNDYINASVVKPNSNIIYHITLEESSHLVEVKVNDKILISFKDTINDRENLSTFTRIIKNQEYLFEDGVLVLKRIIRKCNYLKPLSPSPFLNTQFITMDLETRTIDSVMIPYCISIYDGKNLSSFYLSDYIDSDDMLIHAINSILIRKYDNYKVYLHNFSNFDAIFLLKNISKLSDDIHPIIRDGKIIDLRFKYGLNANGKYNYTLYFRDSLLMLPSSLSKLATTFNVENKGLFPYKFANENNLFYEGIVPNYDFFDTSKVSLEDYLIYKNDFINKNKKWNLRSETIKYCEQDCKTLYQIIAKFNIEIFTLFRIELIKYPTLSSLALAIFRTKFLDKETKIPIISGQIYDDIKKGYTGGSVDVIKPYGIKIFRYDVNSLYPFVMKTFPMPVGNPIYFESSNPLDLQNLEQYFNGKPFGFFNVEVISPDNLNEPILQTRIKNKTIAPLGKWTGCYSSEEIYNAWKYGYKFKVLSGYTFDKDYIFKEYVDFLYEMKVNSSKDSPRYQISKLLLNSLYGRFGMNPHVEEHAIIDSSKSHKYTKCNITNSLDLGNDKELISYINNDSNNENSTLALNISIPIAAMVTSCARVYMSQFKNNPLFKLFYTDTDSIDIDKPLPKEFIGSELGKMKLEHIFNEAIFLAPKVYGGISESYELVKVKGLKNVVPFKELSNLLIKNNKLLINQDKWYKDIEQGNITIKNEIYTLMVTDNKRTLIYDKNNKFIDTKPININNK